MTILWINLAVVFAFAALSRFTATTGNYTFSVVPIKPNKLFYSIAVIFIVIISGLRSNIGDTFFYKHAYEVNAMTWEFIISQKDIGFGILQRFLKLYISENPQVLIFTTALLTNTLIFIVLYKYSRVIELSVYVYITGGLFLVSMNGIRQLLAAAIAFTAIHYLLEGKWKQYTLIILIASLFHLSAFILIPIYFLVRFKAWSRATLILISLSVLIVLAFDQFTSILFALIGDTQYGEYQNFSEGGASTIRVAVAGAPLLIAYLGKEKLKKLFPQNDVIINMSLIGLLFLIISTQSWIFARFSIYFNLYQLILLSWIVKVFRDKDQKIVYFTIIICYFLYYYYETVISLSIEYKSNFL